MWKAMVAKDPFDLLDNTQEPSQPKKIVKNTSKSASVAKKPSTRKKTTTVKKKRRRRSTNRKQVKKGSQLTAKRFFIWCWIFFLFFLLLMTWWVYRILKSNEMLKSLGLDAASVKTLLYLFSWLFFGILTLGMLLWLFLSIYRLATKKWSKLKYILWLIASIVLLIWIVIWRVYAINEIKKIQTWPTLSTNLIVSYIETKDGRIPAEKWIPLIAPMMMSFTVNDSSNASIAREIATSIRNKRPYAVELDCWNGQSLPMQANGQFVWSCLFMEKKQYNFTLNVDKWDWEWMKEYPARWFIPQAAIEIDAIDDTSFFNDDKDEFIIWVAPVDVRFKSELLFSDLNLANDDILWDFWSNGEIDYTNQASFQHTFDDSKLQNIAFRLPALKWSTPITWSKSIDHNDVRYTFDVRVIESELAKCILSKENVRDNRWKFTPSFDEDIQVWEWRYTIYDLVNEEVLATPKSDAKGILSYNLPEGAKYEISMTYYTKDKQKGSCKPIEVNEGYQWNMAVYDLFWKHEKEQWFKKVDIKTREVTMSEDEWISSILVPTSFQIEVLRTEPDPDATIQLYFNEREIYPEGSNVFEFDVNQEWSYEMEFVITTKEGAISSQIVPVEVARNSVQALIQVNGEYVGDDPFNVELDASVSPLYDEDDEIVFFDWDFGDGEIKRKVSQWKVVHEYTFDSENDKGEFYPTVTVYTRKNVQDSYRLPEPIVVKRKQREIEIYMESHPQQQAKVWETVRMSLRTDWLIDTIKRDFGNHKALSCDSRECSETSIIYDEPGIYDIRVEVWYEDNIPSVKTLKIQVY